MAGDAGEEEEEVPLLASTIISGHSLPNKTPLTWQMKEMKNGRLLRRVVVSLTRIQKTSIRTGREKTPTLVKKVSRVSGHLMIDRIEREIHKMVEGDRMVV